MSDSSFVSLARGLIEQAHKEGRHSLLEHEVYRLLEAGGLGVPAHSVIGPGLDDIRADLPGEKVVVKVISAEITHKTEVGGVRIVPNSKGEIESAASAMVSSIKAVEPRLVDTVRGFLVSELVEYDGALGSQLFCGMRFSEGIGHVLAVGFGGVEAEALAEVFREGEGVVLYSPELSTPSHGFEKLATSYFGRLVEGKTREGLKRVDAAELERVLSLYSEFSRELSNNPAFGFTITDFEINPFLARNERLVAVDGVLRFRSGCHEERSVDLQRMESLLKPGTAALMGVSRKRKNIGRVILRNLLREGFSPESIRIVRPDAEPGEEIDGVRCCPSLGGLPWVADLAVIAVAADGVADVLEEVLRTQKARSLVLVPGGMGETASGKEHQNRVTSDLKQARDSGSFAPVMVGPNCLGLRSRPGHYDTLFIPESKLPLPVGGVRDVALISQSGAFMITRMNRMRMLNPRFVISTGNQLDLTVTDFVEAILHDDEVSVFGLYIEGFQPLDGRRLARLIREGRSEGKDFVVYQAGRTSAGRTATSSHTASISGDYASAKAVLTDAGALMSDTFDEFRALLTYSGLLKTKPLNGSRLGIVSNAGYETVGMADSVHEGRFSLAPLTVETCAVLEKILKRNHLEALVNIHNPLDLTPMASEQAYEDCVRACLDDETVDAMVVGAVPMTLALKTLPAGKDPRGLDSVDAVDALPSRMGRLFRDAGKPMAFVVDGGDLYDPMARLMEQNGLPTFRSSDEAIRMLQKYLAAKE